MTLKTLEYAAQQFSEVANLYKRLADNADKLDRSICRIAQIYKQVAERMPK